LTTTEWGRRADAKAAKLLKRLINAATIMRGEHWILGTFRFLDTDTCVPGRWAVWCTWIGLVPRGKLVAATCGVPNCARVSHLRLIDDPRYIPSVQGNSCDDDDNNG